MIPDCYYHLKSDCRTFDVRKTLHIEQPYDKMFLRQRPSHMRNQLVKTDSQPGCYGSDDDDNKSQLGKKKVKKQGDQRPTTAPTVGLKSNLIEHNFMSLTR